jgi:hypothetical protein
MSEIMKKVPEGFRELGFDEYRDWMEQGYRIALLETKVAAASAEERAAHAEASVARSRVKELTSELSIARQQIDVMNKVLGIAGGDDVRINGNTVYIRIVNQEAKVDGKKE